MKRYNLLIAEPSTIIRQGLNTLIDDNQFNIIHVETLDDVPIAIEKHKIELIIINPLVFDIRNIENIQNFIFQYPNLIFVGLIYSYLQPDILPLFHLIINIQDSKLLIDKKMQSIIAKYLNNSHKSELSPREKEVLILLAQGLQSKEIAKKLNLSTHTIISHRKHIMTKTNMKTMGALTAYALLNNIIDEKDISKK